jgi:hypothetical protein
MPFLYFIQTEKGIASCCINNPPWKNMYTVQYCTGGAIVVSHAVLIIPQGRICTVLHWWCYSGKSCCINNPPWKNMYSIALVVLYMFTVQYSATSRCINKHGGICIVFPAVCNLLLRDVQSHFITAKYSLYIA